MTGTALAAHSRFLVGDRVNVLRASRLPKVEEVVGAGDVERITGEFPTNLYWVRGFACARLARELRLVQRRESFDEMSARLAAEVRNDEIDEGIIDG